MSTESFSNNKFDDPYIIYEFYTTTTTTTTTTTISLIYVHRAYTVYTCEALDFQFRFSLFFSQQRFGSELNDYTKDVGRAGPGRGQN